MKKTLLLAGVASCLFINNSNASDYQPYVSAKLSYMQLENDAYAKSSYLYNNTEMENTLINGDHKDWAWGAKIAGGVKKGALRTELELGWNDDAKDSNIFPFTIVNTVDYKFSTETSIKTMMLNAYYDFETQSKFTPYIGAGIGYARAKSTTNINGSYTSGSTIIPVNISAKNDSDNFAWNIGAGVSYQLNEKVAFDAGYRYNDYGSLKASGSAAGVLTNTLYANGDYDFTSHEFLVGVRYSF